MFDPIVAFLHRVFQAIGRGIGLVIAWICWPFVAAAAGMRGAAGSSRGRSASGFSC
jgi:hypothetical protein